MDIKHYTEVEPQGGLEGAVGVKIRWLIKETTGAKNFVMRHFEIAPQGHTPLHHHPWEHELFILSGQGAVTNAKKEEKTLRPGNVVFIPGGEAHQFKNDGKEPFTLLCLIPSKDKCHL
ncbi:MAG: cupin domain-containing protein [Candidatus Brocadiaceae bacterium]|nr:cupin domain-containing protein [Candidatus Brocadiaceae bacterium]